MTRNHRMTLNRVATLIGLLVLATLGVCCSRSAERKPTTPAPNVSPHGQVLTGRVVRIADGVTVTILDSNNTQHRINFKALTHLNRTRLSGLNLSRISHS